MKKKEKPQKRNKLSARRRLIVFAIVAGGFSGFLLYQARQGPSSRPEEQPPPPSTQKADPAAAPPLQTWSVGEALPTIPLLSLTGERLALKAQGRNRPTLLYLFSPTCSICTQTIPDWKELADGAKRESVEVLGISMLDPVRTSRYVREQQIQWSVYCVAGKDSVLALRVQRVPMTLLLDGTGRVAMTIQGRLNGEQKDDIVRFFEEGSIEGP
jgi:peroxiredoxin